MKICEIKELLNAEVLSGEELMDEEVRMACGSDMMSDVLAYVKDQAVLLTGLINPQLVRTAMMMDMRFLVFFSNKRPTSEMLELAKENHIAVLATAERMYEACGKLYMGFLGREQEA